MHTFQHAELAFYQEDEGFQPAISLHRRARGHRDIIARVCTGLAMRNPLNRCHMEYSTLPQTLARPALGVR